MNRSRMVTLTSTLTSSDLLLPHEGGELVDDVGNHFAVTLEGRKLKHTAEERGVLHKIQRKPFLSVTMSL